MRFFESLYILTNTYDNITYLCEIMWDNNYHVLNPAGNVLEKDMFHYTSLFRHVIMETCSFMEEYENYFYSQAEALYQSRVIALKKIAKPAIQKIKEWKDLKKMRNEMVAHTWRDAKTGGFSYRKLFQYDCPRNYMELQLLRSYLRIIVGLIEAEFEIELKQVPGYIGSIHTTITPPKQYGDVYTEMNEVIKEINSLSLAAGKNYQLLAEKIVGQ